MQDFFDKWYEKYREASIATKDRAELIAEVAKEVEVMTETRKYKACREVFLTALFGTTCTRTFIHSGVYYRYSVRGHFQGYVL